MSFTMKFWKVGSNNLTEIPQISLDFEERLENWIEKDPSILGIDVLIIGRQVHTDFGGRIDLLALNATGDCIIIELKKDKTPREIIAQVLDYASWIKKLTYQRIEQIASTLLKESLAKAFSDCFSTPLPENVNVNHSMVIVSSELDDSSERIIEYLAEEYKVNINAIFFQFYKENDNEYLGRAWLMDPEDIQESAETRTQSPWSGYWFINVGEGECRNWDDNLKYHYIGAGQGPRYYQPLMKLKPGDKIFAYMKGLGYVGFGEVEEPAKRISEFVVTKDLKPLLEHDLKATDADENVEDSEKCEYAVRIKWIKSFNREYAKSFKGIFANPNIVCKIRDIQTVEFLEKEFEIL